MWRPRVVVFIAIAALAASPVSAQDSVFLEELTWTEVRDAIQAGTTTVIVPTGGTEQNGPHMVLGKHNYLVKAAAAEIAMRLGDVLVAPVLGYVPEGEIDPPSGHMWAPGTITLPQEYFERVVEFAARSLAAHGFRDIVLLGDSGGNQAGLAAVATMLNDEWAGSSLRIHHVTNYYGPRSGVLEWLQTQGLSAEEIGTHAGVPDTSLLMFVYPEGIRSDLRGPGREGDGSGVRGDPTKATADLGRELMRLQVDAAVRQIEAMRE